MRMRSLNQESQLYEINLCNAQIEPLTRCGCQIDIFYYQDYFRFKKLKISVVTPKTKLLPGAGAF